MPIGVLVSIPPPAPVFFTVTMKVGVKVAVTVVAAVRVTVQEAVPVQPPPLHPVKAESVAGVAGGRTRGPVRKRPPQPVPAGKTGGVVVAGAPPGPVLLAGRMEGRVEVGTDGVG